MKSKRKPHIAKELAKFQIQIQKAWCLQQLIYPLESVNVLFDLMN